MSDLRPLLTIERNNAGRLHVGVLEVDGEGMGVRAYVLSHQDEHTADRIMFRRYDDMVRLMGDNVRTDPSRNAWNSEPVMKAVTA